MIPPNIAQLFPAQIRRRGEEYARREWVVVDHFDDTEILALAFGSDTYDVALTRDGASVRLECSCPYAADGTGPCKHLWALLLIADQDGALQPLLGATQRPTASKETHDAAPSRTPAGKRPAAARPTGTRPSASWLASLTALSRDATRLAGYYEEPAAWPAGRRLVYLIDLPASERTARLTLSLALEHLLKTGEWSAPAVFRHSRAVLMAAPDPLDQRVLPLLLGARSPDPWSASLQFSAPIPLAPELLPSILPVLAATERLRVRRDPGDKPREPVQFAGPGLWHPVVSLAPDPDVPHMLRLHGQLVREHEVWDFSDGKIFPNYGIVLTGNRLGLLAPHPGLSVVAPLLARDGVPVPSADIDALLERLAQFPAPVPLTIHESLAPRVTSVAPVPVAEFDAHHAAPWERLRQGKAAFRATLAFEYGGVRVGRDASRGALFDAAARQWTGRDRRAESAAASLLASLCPATAYDHSRGVGERIVPVAQASTVWRELARLGWIVEVDGHARRASTGVRLQVRSGIDWFSLDGVVSFGDATAPVADVLSAMQRGEFDVALSDGSRGVLGAAESRQLASLAATARIDANGARFARSQTALLDALIMALPDVDVDAAFDKARKELAGFDRVRTGAAPRGFRGTLRPYQRQALGWFRFLRTFGLGGCLADDMGLGKTVQVLALLEARRAEGAGCSLAVVPRSLVFNWMQEAARFTPHLRVVDWSGTTRRGRAFDPAATDLVLTTYGTLRRDALTLSDATFDYVILDEAQAIKNASTATAKAARLLKAGHRLALSGTPVENRIEELWSLLEFLNPGMLGASRTFRAFAGSTPSPQPRADDTAEDPTAGPVADVAAHAIIARALRPVILRRTKAQVAPELPERLEQTVLVELGPEQRAQYDALLARTRLSLFSEVDRLGIARTRMHVLEALLRLRQAACHPALLPAGTPGDCGTSAKFEALLPMLAECAAEGHKALVFSQFTSLLSLLRAELDAAGTRYAYLDGATRDRSAAVADFQDDAACGLFLISLKAGGHGLNLTAAEYVFLLDPWWNPAVEAQAIDRAHRIGQTRCVIATRLVAANTVEEKIIQLQQGKRALADAIVGGDGKGALAGIGREELELLLG